MTRGLTELGMTDVASRSRSGYVFKGAVWMGLAIVLYVIARNYFYVQDGMLDPNFTIIHRAYNFNLMELPLILLAVALVCMALAVTWTNSRRSLLCVAGIYAFLGMDFFALRYYVTYVEPERLLVRQVRLQTPKLDQPIRILHIADIQAGAIEAYQKEIFERIELLQPDIIINTGDFLQVVAPATFESEWAKLHALIKRVNPRLGTYAVFGDTERELYRYKADALEPLVMLSSRDQRIEVGAGALNLHGLSLYQSKSEEWAMRSIEQWLEQSDPNDFRILLGHSPNYSLAVA